NLVNLMNPVNPLNLEFDADADAETLRVDARVALDLARLREHAAVAETAVDEVARLERIRHAAADDEQALIRGAVEIVAELNAEGFRRNRLAVDADSCLRPDVREAEAAHDVGVHGQLHDRRVADADVEVVDLVRRARRAADGVGNLLRALVECLGADVAHVSAFDVDAEERRQLVAALATVEAGRLVPEGRAEVERGPEAFGILRGRRGRCRRLGLRRGTRSHEAEHDT